MQAAEGPFHGVLSDMRRYDTGNPLGWLTAVVELALDDERIGTEFRAWLQDRRVNPAAEARRAARAARGRRHARTGGRREGLPEERVAVRRLRRARDAIARSRPGCDASRTVSHDELFAMADALWAYPVHECRLAAIELLRRPTGAGHRRRRAVDLRHVARVPHVGAGRPARRHGSSPTSPPATPKACCPSRSLGARPRLLDPSLGGAGAADVAASGRGARLASSPTPSCCCPRRSSSSAR